MAPEDTTVHGNGRGDRDDVLLLLRTGTAPEHEAGDEAAAEDFGNTPANPVEGVYIETFGGDPSTRH